MSSSTVQRGERFARRRTGVVREVIGFTTKPTPKAKSDGVRRARLIVPGDPNDETRVRVDQITKTYTPINV